MAAEGGDNNSENDEFFSLDGLDDSEKKDNPSQKSNEKDDASEDTESAFDHYQASKDEVDQYFAENDGEFLSSLKDLKKIESGGEEISSVELDAELLRDKEVGRLQVLLLKFRVIFIPYYFTIEQIRKILKTIAQSKEQASSFFQQLKGEGRKKAIAQLKKSTAATFDPIVRIYRRITRLSLKGKLSFVFAVAILLVTLFFAKDIVTGRFLPDPSRQSLMSFDAVAGGHFLLPVEYKTESFDSALRHPEYVIQLRHIVTSLRPSTQRKSNPRAAVELYLEATNQEVAIEIRDREPEFIDRIQRTLEGMTERELSTERGKERMKGFIRRDLNALATKGRVKRVYIKKLNFLR